MAEGFVSRLKTSLNKTRQKLWAPLEAAVHSHKKISPEFYEELEEILIMADVGYPTTALLLERLKEQVKEEKVDQTAKVKAYLRDLMIELLTVPAPSGLAAEEALAFWWSG